MRDTNRPEGQKPFRRCVGRCGGFLLPSGPDPVLGKRHCSSCVTNRGHDAGSRRDRGVERNRARDGRSDRLATVRPCWRSAGSCRRWKRSPQRFAPRTGDASHLRADVIAPDAPAAIVEAVQEAFGGLTALVNAAGIIGTGTVENDDRRGVGRDAGHQPSRAVSTDARRGAAARSRRAAPSSTSRASPACARFRVCSRTA